MHILIIRVSAIGDVIHNMPALFLLKHHFPHAHIHWVVQKKAAHLLIGQPFLDHVWVLPDKYLRFAQLPQTIKIIKGLRQYKWDAIIDFQGLLKTALLALPLSGKKYGFSAPHAREKINAWFTHHHDSPTYTNIIQKNLSLASAVAHHLGATTSSQSIDTLKQTFQLTAPSDKQNNVDAWLANNNISNYILLCPNTTWESKHWPNENWVSFIELFSKTNPNITPILVGTTFGPAAVQIEAICQHQKTPIVICPAWDLLTMSYLIKKSSLVIAPDTGLLHIADFLGSPALGIFGPTHKEKHGPFLTTINKELSLQIACPHFYQKTHGPDKTLNCMAALTPQQLLDQVLRYLEKSPKKTLQ